MKQMITSMMAALAVMSMPLVAQNMTTSHNQTVRPPVMGWSSWNNFHIRINEDIIKGQADAMVATGMDKVGYQYVNIDDGYFGGRDQDGNLLAYKERFPNGMRAVSDYIHAKGLKAGIYTDGGINTCGCHGDRDTISVGAGIYGHELADLQRMFIEWNYDFLKVDWCGGRGLGLDEQTQYTKIANLLYEMRPDAIFNICRWQFPGKWATNLVDSWRISGDIRAEFKSITKIIDLNADLWPYCTPGHYNDMDMLQVGRGMSYDEDKAHFTMWCMMNSPLLAGNDLTDMSEQTLGIFKNKDIIALDQDPLAYQARRIRQIGELEVWAKPLKHTLSGQVAVTLFNRSNEASEISFNLGQVSLKAADGYTMKDLWSKKSYARSTEEDQTFTVPSHGVVTLLIQGTALRYNVFQSK